MLKSFSVWLEPPLDQLEREYRSYYLPSDIRHAIVVGIIFIVGNLGLIAADYAMFSTSDPFWVLLVTRLILGCAAASFIMILTQIRRSYIYDRFVFFCAMFIAVMSVVIDSYRPIDFPSRFMVYLVLIFSIYLVLPNTLWFRLIAGAFVTVTCIISMFTPMNRNTEIMAILMLVCLLVANWVGVYSSARYYTYRRHGYQALHQARALNEKLAVLADTDPLTGIYNRRKFYEIGLREFSRFRRRADRLTVGVLDLDHFKNVNDSYGHQVGDQVLEILTRVITREIRSADILGRLGGEEFGLVFPDTDLAAAHQIAERVRQAIDAAPELAALLDKPLTISMGISEACASDRSFDDLVRRADAALYRAKANGRNCVIAE